VKRSLLNVGHVSPRAISQSEHGRQSIQEAECCVIVGDVKVEKRKDKKKTNRTHSCPECHDRESNVTVGAELGVVLRLEITFAKKTIRF
jgi:hypothetical protein